MANTNKMGKKEMFLSLLSLEGLTDAQKGFITREIESLDKRSVKAAIRRGEKSEEKKSGDFKMISDFVRTNGGRTLGTDDLANELGVSRNKAAVLVKYAIEGGLAITKGKEKGKVVYNIGEAE